MQASTHARAHARSTARTGSSTARRAASRATRPLAWRWLLLFGAVVFVAGAVGDLAFHTLPADLARGIEPLVGGDGYRAHLVTFAGMAMVIAGLVARGLHR